MKTTPSSLLPFPTRRLRAPWWLVASGALVLNLAGAGWITCHELPSLKAPPLAPLPQNPAG